MNKEDGGTIDDNDNMNTVSVPLDIFEQTTLISLIRDQIERFERPWPFGLSRALMPAKAQYHSTKWKTFPDFLSDYLKKIIGEEWGNAFFLLPHGVIF